MNCPICFELINHSCIGSCMHHFCYNCLIKWCRVGGNKCPVCKHLIYEIRKDKEFDTINNPNEDEILCEYTKKICIDFNNIILPGITLINNNGPGVNIKSLKHNELCSLNGLKVNDKFEFNITEHFDQLLNNDSYSNDLYLLPVGAAVNANRTILNDIKLIIHYSEL